MTINVSDRTYQEKTVQMCSIMIPSNKDDQSLRYMMFLLSSFNRVETRISEIDKGATL